MTTRLWTGLVLVCTTQLASAAAVAREPTDGPAGANGAPPRFDNVFVNRESYRSFLASGRWPDKTTYDPLRKP